MATNHTVVQGEYISKIAAQYGFTDWKPIWEHADNAELRSKRKNPNVIYPGDVIHIPDKESRIESKPTEKHHRFQVLSGPPKLRIKVLDVNAQPVTNTQCYLVVDTQSFTLTSDGQGLIEQVIPPTAASGRLTVQNPAIPIDLNVELNIGHLDPVEEREGQQARLINLGYYPGEVGSNEPFKFKQAVEEFQRDHGLSRDGICGTNTQNKLKDVHGC